MKTKLLLSALLSFSFYLLSSQVPQGFNYQAIARDGSGNPITGATIKVKLSILTDTLGFRAGTGGLYVWEEEHTGVVTNAYGLFTVILGDPAATWIQGAAGFNLIDWNKPKLFIGTKIANPTVYKVLGGAKLWSVPYAMISGNLSGPVKKLAIKSLNTSPDSAIFEVKNNLGQTVFAVYNEGVRVYVDDGEKGITKGGFAIGSFGTDKAPSKSLLIVNTDSIRAYIDTTYVGKGITKGGFAIGGFGTEKTIGPKYLSINSNMAKISVNDSVTGFSLSNIKTGVDQDFLKMNAINYRLGHQSGEKLNQVFAKYNTFFGYQTGRNTVDGRENLFIGYQAGYNNSSASYNVYMGTESGKSNVNGTSNVFIGFGTGKASTTSANTLIGYKAGFVNAAGTSNTYIGYQAGLDDGRPGYTGGSYNLFLGFNAGSKNYTGSYNVNLGAEAGGNSRGSGRVLIGYKAGYALIQDSILVIDNHSSSTPLVFGNFATNTFRINGNIEYTGTITGVSDAALKMNVTPLENTLDKLLNISASSFFWKTGVIPNLEMSDKRQIGLIAQDLEKYFPELIGLTDEGYKTVDYTKIGVLILPALRELNNKLNLKESEINELRDEVNSLKSRLADMERKIELILNTDKIEK